MADVLVDTSNNSPTQLQAQGVKAYILQDYDAAVTALSKAIELLVAEHGSDLHDSLGEVYLYYGKALLGLSREENGALGDAVPKDEEEDDDEEDDEQGEDADGAAEAEEPEGAVKNGSAEASAPATEEKPENEEEASDLQVAWEVLELAKKIFQKLGDAGKKHLGDTLTVLGEVSLESENFEAAVADIEEGLEIQKQLFGTDSRTVAETFYKLGIAYSNNSQIDEAVRSFESSLEYLGNRLARSEDEEEKEEIRGLMPDVEEKIADMKSYKEEALKKIVSAVTEGKTTETASSSSSDASKPASNISHLVKRKRKADEITEEKEPEDNPAKKVK